MFGRPPLGCRHRRQGGLSEFGHRFQRSGEHMGTDDERGEHRRNREVFNEFKMGTCNAMNGIDECGYGFLLRRLVFRCAQDTILRGRCVFVSPEFCEREVWYGFLFGSQI